MPFTVETSNAETHADMYALSLLVSLYKNKDNEGKMLIHIP